MNFRAANLPFELRICPFSDVFRGTGYVCRRLRRTKHPVCFVLRAVFFYVVHSANQTNIFDLCLILPLSRTFFNQFLHAGFFSPPGFFRILLFSGPPLPMGGCLDQPFIGHRFFLRLPNSPFSRLLQDPRPYFLRPQPPPQGIFFFASPDLVLESRLRWHKPFPLFFYFLYRTPALQFDAFKDPLGFFGFFLLIGC